MKTLIGFIILCSSIGYAKEPASSGRFQLVQLGNMRADQYLLDTQTGRLWNKQCSVSTKEGCELESWNEQDVIGLSTSAQAHSVNVSRTLEYLKEKAKGEK